MPTRGLIIVGDETGNVDLVWLAVDVDADLAKFSGEGSVEVVADLPQVALLERFLEVLRVHQPARNVLVENEPDHPHLELTDEPFPRLLATRRPRRVGRTFGPFLPRTAARRLIGLAGRVCKLRTCTVAVDGSFETPCGEHAAGRCLAPCVGALCSAERYAEAVVDAALLVGNRADDLLGRIDERVAAAAETLDFETAARLREDRTLLAELYPNLRLRIGLEGATDVIAVLREGAWFGVLIDTSFRGRVLGRRLLVAACQRDDSDEWLLTQVLAQAYRGDAPSHIFSPVGGPRLTFLVRAMARREGRRVSLISANRDEWPKTIRLAQMDAEGRLAERFVALRTGRPLAGLDDLTRLLALPSRPRKVVAIDVAHLRGEAVTAAAVVARDGVLRPEESSVWFLDESSELGAIERAVACVTTDSSGEPPDAIVVDGGKAQLAAAVRGLGDVGIPVLAVAKGPNNSREINYGLARVSGVDTKVVLDKRSEAHHFVTRLRDEAHDAANAGHRTLREHLQIALGRRAGATESVPLVVPTRFDVPDGAASDLLPILPEGRSARPHTRGHTRSRRPAS